MGNAMGQQAEALACSFLEQQGLTLITKNYRCPLGEIDIIMLDGATVVFIEVRLRRLGRFGRAEDSVTQQKQQKIIRTAQHFRKNYPNYSSQACRFDIVVYNGHDPGKTPPHWLTQVF